MGLYAGNPCEGFCVSCLLQYLVKELVNEKTVTVECNGGKLPVFEPFDLGRIISGDQAAIITADQKADHQYGVVQRGFGGSDTQEGIDGSIQTGFFCQFPERPLFGVLTQLDKTAGQAPQPFLGFDAALNQQKLGRVVDDHEAGRRNGIFINGAAASGAEKPQSPLNESLGQSLATIGTMCLVLHGALRRNKKAPADFLVGAFQILPCDDLMDDRVRTQTP